MIHIVEISILLIEFIAVTLFEHQGSQSAQTTQTIPEPAETGHFNRLRSCKALYFSGYFLNILSMHFIYAHFTI